MQLDVSPLFQPLIINSTHFPNRIVMPPMRTMLDLTSDEVRNWYSRRARGGAGCIIVEGVAVQSFSSEFAAKNLKPLVDEIHNGGAVAVIQLIPVPLELQGTAPSELTKSEIESILLCYQKAAEECMAAGFDGLQVHGAHGFTLNQFFSPEQNKRCDEFGGALTNRMRLAVDIVTALRSTCGNELLLCYRHTPIGAGYDMQESCQLSQLLLEAGVDVLDLSPSSLEYPGDKAAPFTQFGVPVVTVGRLDKVTNALEVITKKRADFVAIGRGLITDPDWPNKVKASQFDDILMCNGCNTQCYGNLDKRIPITCIKWRPEVA